jgi:hypothetical protein
VPGKVSGEPRGLHAVPHLLAETLDYLGIGRIVASEKDLPILLVNMV